MPHRRPIKDLHVASETYGRPKILIGEPKEVLGHPAFDLKCLDLFETIYSEMKSKKRIIGIL